MDYKYEEVVYSSKYPAKILLPNKPGRRCNTSLHWHQAIELLYMIDGSLNIKDNTEVSSIAEGGAYLVNSNHYHRTFTDVTEDNIKYLVVLLSFEKLRKYYPDIENTTFVIREIDTKNKICALLKNIADFYEEKTTGYELKINSLIYDLFYVLVTECSSTKAEATDDNDVDICYVKQAIKYMEQNFKNNISLNDISSAVGLSVSYFSRCFKRITRMSAMHYLAEMRLESALREMVEKDKNVTDAALDNGFTSVKSFIELCKKTYDCTPKKYIHRV